MTCFYPPRIKTTTPCVFYFSILPLKKNRKFNNPTKGDQWTMGISQQSNTDQKTIKPKEMIKQ
jgi:hypothetical protein